MADAAPPEPARAHLRRHPDLDLLFDPDADWFADVSLAQVTPDGDVEVLRGTLTDRARRAVAEWGAAGVVGVFVNGVGRIELHRPGATFYDDPRDVHSLAAADVYDGPTLTAIAARLRTIAQWLDARAADGWTIVSLSNESLAITDAPDRVPAELDWPVGQEPVDFSGGADLNDTDAT